MNTATIKHLLMLYPPKWELIETRLYQLIDLAERCYCLKDTKGQHELGLLLQEFSSPFDLIGSYYEGVSLCQMNLLDEAKKRLERVYEHGHTVQGKSIALTKRS